MALNAAVNVLSGLAVDRPANPGFPGVIYIATDTREVFFYDGAAWQIMVGAPGSNVVVFLALEESEGEPMMMPPGTV